MSPLGIEACFMSAQSGLLVYFPPKPILVCTYHNYSANRTNTQKVGKIRGFTSEPHRVLSQNVNACATSQLF